MKTRKERLQNECTHSEYYSQFVNDAVRNVVLNRFDIKKLKTSYIQEEDRFDIPLTEWDMLTNLIRWSSINEKMKEAGDYMTLAGLVCILKEAARQIINK